LNKPIVLNVESNNNNSRVISSWSSTYWLNAPSSSKD
jgi:hypothetical protein